MLYNGFIYRCFIAGLYDFIITFYLYLFIYGLLSEINRMYVCMYVCICFTFIFWYFQHKTS